MLDSICHVTLKLLRNQLFVMKMFRFGYYVVNIFIMLLNM